MVRNAHSPMKLAEAHMAQSAGLLNIVLGFALLAAVVFLWRLSPLSRWRISSCIAHSKQRYAAKEYDDALASALEAKRMSRAKLGASSDMHERAMMHLAATHAAMQQSREAQQHGQSGRLGGATAGHHGLIGLHLKA